MYNKHTACIITVLWVEIATVTRSSNFDDHQHVYTVKLVSKACGRHG